MNFINYEVAKCIMEEKIRNHLRDAETKRLLKEIRMVRGSWLSRRMLHVLTTLGRLLVALGQKLENYGISSVYVSSDTQNPGSVGSI